MMKQHTSHAAAVWRNILPDAAANTTHGGLIAASPPFRSHPSARSPGNSGFVASRLRARNGGPGAWAPPASVVGRGGPLSRATAFARRRGRPGAVAPARRRAYGGGAPARKKGPTAACGARALATPPPRRRAANAPVRIRPRHIRGVFVGGGAAAGKCVRGGVCGEATRLGDVSAARWGLASPVRAVGRRGGGAARRGERRAWSSGRVTQHVGHGCEARPLRAQAALPPQPPSTGTHSPKFYHAVTTP